MALKNKIISLVLVLCMLVPSLGAFAQVSYTVAFMGNTELVDELYQPYSDLMAPYLEGALGGKVDIVNAKPIDLASQHFMNSVTNDVAPKNPDVVFMEINISKRYPFDDAEITARLESMLRTLLDGGKTPTIYFVYTPMESMLDFSEPYDKLAERYGIRILDVYSRLYSEYKNGTLRTKDFLSAGERPAEKGQDIYVRAITNELKNYSNILNPAKTDVAPLSSVRYGVVEEEAPADSPELPADGITLYVDGKTGSDTNAGTIDAPLFSVEAARNKLRLLRKNQGADFKGATIYLREGTYRFLSSFELTEEDSGTDTGRVVYSAYNGENVRFTNATVLKAEDFVAVTDENVLRRLHTNGLGNVLQYNLNKNGILPGVFLENYETQVVIDARNPAGGNVNLGNMFMVGGRMEERSRWPNGGFVVLPESYDKGALNFGYDGTTDPERWNTNTGDAFIRNMRGSAYFTFFTRFSHTDAENNNVVAAFNQNWNASNGWGVWSMVNILEELDVPGEWCVEKSGILYYYPREDFYTEEIQFSSNRAPVIKMDKTKNITIKGITIEGSCHEGILLNDGTANIVDGCTLRNLGNVAIRINNSGSAKYGRNGVINSHIYCVAGGGVYIFGGERQTLTEQKDYVHNCHFEDFVTIGHHGSAGVFTSGTVGVYVTNCLFHNDDATAVELMSSKLHIEKNEFTNLVKDSDDTGALYGQGAGHTDQGLYITNNYLHDINYTLDQLPRHSGARALYIDAMGTSGAEIRDNVFRNTDTGFYNNTSHNQTLYGNLFMDGSDMSIEFYDTYWWDAAKKEKLENWVKEQEDKNILETYRGFDYKVLDNPDKSDLLLFYNAYLQNPHFAGENKVTYYRNFPWLEYYLDDGILGARNLLVQNNAVFNCGGTGEVISFASSRGSRGDNTDKYNKSNYITLEKILGEETPEGHYARIDAAMAEAKKRIPEFEVWDVRTAGLLDAPKPVGNFRLIAPINGQKEVKTDDIRLSWDYASGADKYYVEVATDSEFNNIVFEGTSVNNHIIVTGLESGYKKYYWRVKAQSYSKSFTGTPLAENGPYTFYTCRYMDVDSQELGEYIAAVEAKLAKATEGTEAGQYEQGSIDALNEKLTNAKEVYSRTRVEQTRVDEALRVLKTAYLRFLTKVNLTEVDLKEAVFNKDNISEYTNDTGATPVSESKVVTITDDSYIVNGKSSGFTNKEYGNHEILHCTMNADFGGISTAYAVLGLSVKSMVQSVWSAKSYIVLFTKSAIELQAFKPTSHIGEIYYSVPNTFLTEGEDHDVEFAAIPHSKGIRLILRVDGKVVYDYVDMQNIIADGGAIEIHSNNPSVKLKITPPKTDLPYPTLCELLKDDPEAPIE